MPRRHLRFALFCQSIVSDWNHGNAHFLRGLIRNLQKLGHQVLALEEEGNWSCSNLVRDHGTDPLREFDRRFPFIDSHRFVLDGRAHLFDWLSDLLSQVDVVLVHEWNPPDLVRAIGDVAARRGVVSLFHDTHHRALTDPGRIPSLGLDSYSAVLAYGPTIAELYRNVVDGPEVLVFHEGADADLFRPLRRFQSCDVVFVGNWGDDDRNLATWEFFIEPCLRLRDLNFALFGVRYPPEVLAALRRAGIVWGGWLPNYLVPEAYAVSKVTLHIPRKEYVESLKGTPTIRVFEALACGMPLVSAGWRDDAGLFEEGDDYLAVDSPSQMAEAVRWLATDPTARARLGERGRATVLARHTCLHRADELVGIAERLRGGADERNHQDTKDTKVYRDSL
ncbi:MAG: glycosyltransferase [Actinobacteria bacterium]|nr:glycosyltransferase [Actinomycetota bacterium]